MFLFPFRAQRNVPRAQRKRAMMVSRPDLIHLEITYEYTDTFINCMELCPFHL